MLTQKDYQTALDIQNACNLSGVIRCWTEMTARIWEDIWASGGGTREFNRHPINVLFASKVESLTEASDFSNFSSCCETIEKKVKVETK
jgi:hypothetical protein